MKMAKSKGKKKRSADPRVLTSISIPISVKERMEEMQADHRDINWSAIATQAFVDEMDRREGKPTELERRLARLEKGLNKKEKRK